MNCNEEALKPLYKLDYEHPDDYRVKRALAWVLTMSGRYEQAGKQYQKLLSAEKPEPVDMLNYGYCLWFAGDVAEAIVHFKQFLLSKDDDSFSLENEFLDNEHQLIVAHGVSDTEIQLMLDALQA